LFQGSKQSSTIPFRLGRSERHRLSPRRRRASPRPRHELPNPCHVLRSLPLTSLSSTGRSSMPMPSVIGFCHRRSTSHRRPPRVLVRCRRSILELHHDTPVPTILTTSSTHHSSGVAPVTPSVEPPPPPRALSSEPLLPGIPQSGYPRCRVALAAILDPPRRQSTPESSRPPPPLLLAPWALPCLAVCCQPGKKPHALGPALAEARASRCTMGHATSSMPWAA
jgi:hypothetical protein